MLDRSKPPEFKVPDKFHLPKPQKGKLKNNIPLYVISSGKQPAIRVEFIFRAGIWYEPFNGVSYFTGKLLTGGTSKYSANQIEEKLAGFGAFLEINPGKDHVNVTLFCLQKHLPEILPFLGEILTDPVFPSDELENQKNISVQQIRVNKEKTSYLASVTFREKLFGLNHPYGRALSEKNVIKINAEHLKEYYNQAFGSSSLEIFVSGNPGEYEELFNKHFASFSWGDQYARKAEVRTDFSPGLKEIEKAGSLQTSIRLGFPLFTMSHPDYFPMTVVNEILGGYFGSRLMKNIREEKGLTYGIHSNAVCLLNSGYWFTGTDVKKENAKETIAEINKEINKLKSESVPLDELEIVKNTLRGSFLNSINTPFAVADKFKTLHYNNLSVDFYARYFDFIEKVDPEEIKKATEKYFKPENYLIVTAG